MNRPLIAGLGNPGAKYAANRHNAGFMCLDRLAAVHGLAFSRTQKQALVALGSVAGHDVILAKPQTYMNESGRAVAALVRFYGVALDRLLVVYDDLDLPLGTLRMRPEGGTGGHKGMTSVIQHLGGSQSFPRLRIGIGRPPGRMDPAAYVLQDFPGDELLLFGEVLGRAVDTIQLWLDEGIDAAMNACNAPSE
jgi:PTH1 family peptidyl-tRNA hydrolase